MLKNKKEASLTIVLEYKGKKYHATKYILDIDKMMRFVKFPLPRMLWIEMYKLRYGKKPSDEEILAMCIGDTYTYYRPRVIKKAKRLKCN